MYIINSLFSKNKPIFIVFVIFFLVNSLIFITPLGLALFTWQPALFLHYLLLFLATNVSPLLLMIAFKTKNVILILIVVLLFGVPLLGKKIVESLPHTSEVSHHVEETNLAIQLDVIRRIKKKEDLLNYPFCFKIFLPTVGNFVYSPDSYNPGFYEGSASTKDCERQLLIATYNPLTARIIEVHKSYDFDFRKDYEDLKELQQKAISGEKIINGENTFYLAKVRMYGDFMIAVNPDDGVKDLKLLYTELEDTLIFAFYEDTEESEAVYSKLFQGLVKIN